jgi:hypothetical protein
MKNISFTPVLMPQRKMLRILVLLSLWFATNGLFAQFSSTGITVEEEASACQTCTGKLKVFMPLDLLVPAEVTLTDGKNNVYKRSLKTPADLSKELIFENVCAGAYELLIVSSDPRFANLECGKKEHKGVINGSGEGNFSIDLVSNLNNTISIKTSAFFPTFQWSNGKSTQNISDLETGSYTVTITDGAGCTKVAGPFSTLGTCYDPQKKYIGEKFEVRITGVQDDQKGLVHTGNSSYELEATRQDKPAFPASTTFKWFTAAGVLLAETAKLTIPAARFGEYKSVKAVVTSPCEQREVTIALYECGATVADPFKAFGITTEPSCFYRTTDIAKNEVKVDTKSGKVSFRIPNPTGNPAITVKWGSQSYTATQSQSFGMLTITGLEAKEEKVIIEYANGCKYEFLVKIPAKEAFYETAIYDPAKNLCNLKYRCTKGLYSEYPLLQGVSLPPIRDYYVGATSSNGKTRRTKCERKVVCGAGTFTMPISTNEPPIDAMITYAGIFNEIINKILSDPTVVLSDEERQKLLDACTDNIRRKPCRKVSFCPGSFEPIDESHPFPGIGLERRGEGFTNDGGCFELDCGRGNAREKKSTCDPELKAVIDITAPVGLDGGVCSTPEQEREESKPKPDNPEPNPCLYYQRTSSWQIMRTPLDKLDLIPGSQLESVYQALWTRAGEIDELIDQRGVGIVRMGCYYIRYCKATGWVTDYPTLMNQILYEDCTSCKNSDAKNLTLADFYIPGADLSNPEFKILKDKTWFVAPASRNCIPVTVCNGRILNIDAVMKNAYSSNRFGCKCDQDDHIVSVRFDELLRILTGKNADVEFKILTGGHPYLYNACCGHVYELENIVKEGLPHNDGANSPNCRVIQFCAKTNKVIDYEEQLKYFKDPRNTCKRRNIRVPIVTIKIPRIIFNSISDSNSLSKKYFNENERVNERFDRFIQVNSSGILHPKAIIQDSAANKFLNYSHDVEHLRSIADSNMVYRSDDWDHDEYWYLDKVASRREYWISYDGAAENWGASFESDSLLVFGNIVKRDSILYLSGMYTGAFRFGGQLMNTDYSHDQMSTFVIALNTKGQVRGLHIFKGIDTTYAGFKMDIQQSGALLVAGQGFDNQGIKLNGTPMNLNGKNAFCALIDPLSHQYNLVKPLDLGGAKLLRAAISPSKGEFAVAVGLSNPAGPTGVFTAGAGLNVVHYDANGALVKQHYLKGGIDFRQFDIIYDTQNQINMGLTFVDTLRALDSLYFEGSGKEDIAIIRLDTNFQLKANYSYGTEETETVNQLMYSAGVLFFGGNFRGAQETRTVGEYDFYNLGSSTNRAYVSFVYDLGNDQDSTGAVNELAYFQSPKLKKAEWSKNTLKAYPNPFQNQITAEFILDTPGEITLQLFNQLGNVVEVRKINANDGLNREQISTNSLPSGLYFLHLHDAQNRQIGVQKVLKM